MTSTDTTGKMATVRALLDKAERTDNPHEEAAYRAKAEGIMAKYKIEVNDLLASRTAQDAQVISPIRFDITLAGQTSPYFNQYAMIFGNIARHVGIRHTFTWKWSESGYVVHAEGVGFEMDVQYAELMFTQARLVFAERLEPRLNPDMTDQENVYRLRSAGIERKRIADIMWDNTDPVFMARVGRLYKAECAARNEEPVLSGRGVTGAAYREAYAEGFVNNFYRRLIKARDAAGVGGGGLVLGNREAKLTEEFYRHFPDLRPKAEVAGGQVEEECDKCEKAKSGRCQEHKTKAVRMPKGRDPYSEAAQRGRMSGHAAANAVDLGRMNGTRAVSN